MAKSASTRRGPKPSSKSEAIPSLLATSPLPPSKYPFTKSSEALARFLATLPHNHVYLLHIDTFTASHKRRIFTVPLLLNIFISLLLLWRAYTVIPSYFSILLATLGYPSDASVDIHTTDWAALLDIGARRAGMFFLDFALVKFVAMWPLDFFWGTPVGPALWRWKIGFRDREVVVRRSRRWSELLAGDDEEILGEGKLGSKAFEERVLPGINAEWVRGRTGMSMLDKNWDLWFQGMVNAHENVEKGKMRMEDFDGRAVVVHTESMGWLVWKIEEEDEGGKSASKFQRVKAKLEQMGKEGLFWSWVELVQFETETREGLMAKGVEDVRKKCRELFEAQGVDFDKFWEQLGGMEGMPEMRMSGP